MKKYISIFLAVLLVCSMSITAFAASNDSTEKIIPANLRVASEDTSAGVDALAAEHLSTTKCQFSGNPSALGFTADELSGAALGTAFTLYVFDTDGRIVSDETLVYPIVYNNEIIAVLEMYYDSASSAYCYTFGKAYAEDLNEIRYESAVNTDANLIIGRIADKLFITDGSKVDIIYNMPVDQAATISTNEIKNVCSDLAKNVSASFSEIDRISVQSEQFVSESSQSGATPRLLPNPLPVPHVAQTGVCGVAAWAAVLNYRFDTDYTNATLATAMEDDYSNGTGGIPNMDDYRDYANDVHDAGCVRANSLSFSTMKSKINGGRPIMGSWYSGSGSDKSWHAIIITGYVQNSTSNYTYVLKNPWYTNTQTITVTSASSVVYADAGYTWNLSQSVY